MGFVASSMAMAYSFLYGFNIPNRWEITLVALSVYAVHLAISGGITYASVRLAGGSSDLITGFAKALFTVFVRDLIGLPLLVLVIGWPIFGLIIAFAAWLGLIKFVFHLSWLRSVLVFIISLILPFVILLFILIPIALFFM